MTKSTIIEFIFIFALLPSALAAQTPWCLVQEHTTRGIQAAIDACAAKGGGVAYVPSGQYTIGPVWLKDNVDLHLEAGAMLNASRNAADWPAGAPAVINAFGVKNVAVTGQGTIDGRSQYVYAPMRSVDVEIAHEIELVRKAGVPLYRYYRTGISKNDAFFYRSQNIRLEGVRFVEASNWTVRLQDCHQVEVRGVYVYSNLEKGVNEDGIDIVSTSNVMISDSTIITGDDAICLKTTRYRGAPPEDAKLPVEPTENILVNNCLLSSSSSAMVIGTETYADIRSVIFSNIVVRNSNRVFGINVQDGATVSGVRFQNVVFDLNRRHWNWWGNADVFKFVLKKRNPDSKLGRIQDITISGAQGTARGTSLIAGTAERPLTGITVEGLRVRMLPENTPDLRASDALVMEHIDGLTLRGIEVDWGEPRQSTWGSALVLRDINNLTLSGFHGAAGSSNTAVPAIVKENVTEARP